MAEDFLIVPKIARERLVAPVIPYKGRLLFKGIVLSSCNTREKDSRVFSASESEVTSV